MTAVLIVLIIICLIITAAYIIGNTFFKKLIVRQDDFPTPETGAHASSLLAPTGEELWSYNIPFFARFRALPFEDVSITSDDGLTLHADMIRKSDTAPTVLFFHGYKASPVTDFAAMYDFYDSLGCNLIYVHMRAHGKSEGKYIGFGVLDRFDVVRWTHKAEELFPDSDIYLHGMSMGAASVLQSADLGLSRHVRGIIADCGYSCIDTVFRNLVGKVFHMPATPFVNIFEYVNLLKAGYGFKDADSVKSVANTSIPIIYICGDKDIYVPEDMANAIYSACRSEKKLLMVPDTGHAACYMRAKADYERLVRQMIEKK